MFSIVRSGKAFDPEHKWIAPGARSLAEKSADFCQSRQDSIFGCRIVLVESLLPGV